jgi:hypothetical protein
MPTTKPCVPPKNLLGFLLMATKQEIRDYFAKFGKEGGKTRAKNMSPEQRSEAARKAVAARWAKTDRTLARMEKTSVQLAQKAKALEKLSRAKARKAEAGRPRKESE